MIPKIIKTTSYRGCQILKIGVGKLLQFESWEPIFMCFSDHKHYFKTCKILKIERYDTDLTIFAYHPGSLI